MLKIPTVMFWIAACIPVDAKLSAFNVTEAADSRIRWKSCLNSEFASWFPEASPQSELRCGYLTVPLAYQQDSSITHPENTKNIRLALTLLPAKGVRKGSIVMVSGGPGQSGINTPWIALDGHVAKLREAWDIVGYDPRGVGQSTPKIDCRLKANTPAVSADNEAEAIAEMESSMFRKIAACVEHTGADVLQHIGTNEAASDMDRIRQALGDSKLTAVAYSYGTKVAAIYAARFPAQTRALVLDGVVNFAEDDFTQRLGQAQGFQLSFVRFAAWCEQTGSCPLSKNQKHAKRTYHALLQKLDGSPLKTPAGEEIDAGRLLRLTISLLLWPDEWPKLATIIKQLNAGIVSKQLIDMVKEDEIQLANDAISVITCADVAVPGANKDRLRIQEQKIIQATPFSNYRPLQYYPLDMCAFWPWQGKDSNQMPVISPLLPPLLFVAQRYDPTTPWKNARTMANAFKSPLITLEKEGHTLSLSGHDLCMDNIIIGYLKAPQKLREDKICR